MRAAQLRDIEDELKQAGAGVVVVGSGLVDHARHFQEETELEARMVVDPTRASYRAAGFVRGIVRTLGPAAWVSGIRAMASGHRQGKMQGDPWQHGGTLVLGEGETVLLHHVSRATGDHADNAGILAAVRSAT